MPTGGSNTFLVSRRVTAFMMLPFQSRNEVHTVLQRHSSPPARHTALIELYKVIDHLWILTVGECGGGATCRSSAVVTSRPVISSILWLIVSTTGCSNGASQALTGREKLSADFQRAAGSQVTGHILLAW